MRFEKIVDLPDGGWDLGPYFAYLHSIRTELSPAVAQFALDRNNYDLRSRQSLQRAWLESLHIAEPSRGTRSELRQTRIDLCFLGPYRDRKILLTYTNVAAHSVFSPLSGSGHGQVSMHELSRARDGSFDHLIRFASGSAIKLRCSGLAHKIEITW